MFRAIDTLRTVVGDGCTLARNRKRLPNMNSYSGDFDETSC